MFCKASMFTKVRDSLSPLMCIQTWHSKGFGMQHLQGGEGGRLGVGGNLRWIVHVHSEFPVITNHGMYTLNEYSYMYVCIYESFESSEARLMCILFKFKCHRNMIVCRDYSQIISITPSFFTIAPNISWLNCFTVNTFILVILSLSPFVSFR